MRKTERGAELTIQEIDTFGQVLDNISYELRNEQPDMKKALKGLDLLQQTLFLMLPDHVIEGVAVARGESEVVLWESEEQGLSLEFVAEQEVPRWKREVGAVVVSPAVVQGYRLVPPLCSKCWRYDMCHDMAADDHMDEDIDAALALAREQECWAIDEDRLLEDAAASGDLESWAVGA